MRVITANVNGVRAAARRGGLGWLAAQEADVLCLQEVRATDAHLAQALGDAGLGAWHVAHTEAADKGRAGVVVVSRQTPSRVQVGVGAQEFATCGRWVEIDLPTAAGPVTIVSAYVHTGEAATARQEEKYRFLDAMNERMAAWSAAGDLALLTGDLNVAHREDDLKNWKGNLKRAGFLPRERAYFDRWFEFGDWADTHRELHGPGPGPYTWWSWRGQAFDNDTGWRIDYQLASRPLADRAQCARVGRAAAYDVRWSDHAAVTVDYDLG